MSAIPARYTSRVTVPPHRLRRRRTRLALLALPLLLHLLMPTGFMPVSAAEGFIGLCPAAAPMPPGMVMPEPAHRGGATGDDGRAHGSQCPFAKSGTAAGTATPPRFAVEVRAVTAPVEPALTSRHVPAIVRAQSSRGPPLPPR